MTQTMIPHYQSPQPARVSELERVRRRGPFRCTWCGRQAGQAGESPFAWVYYLQVTKRKKTVLPGMFCGHTCCASYHNLRP